MEDYFTGASPVGWDYNAQQHPHFPERERPEQHKVRGGLDAEPCLHKVEVALRDRAVNALHAQLGERGPGRHGSCTSCVATAPARKRTQSKAHDQGDSATNKVWTPCSRYSTDVHGRPCLRPGGSGSSASCGATVSSAGAASGVRAGQVIQPIYKGKCTVRIGSLTQSDPPRGQNVPAVRLAGGDCNLGPKTKKLDLDMLAHGCPVMLAPRMST